MNCSYTHYVCLSPTFPQLNPDRVHDCQFTKAIKKQKMLTPYVKYSFIIRKNKKLVLYLIYMTQKTQKHDVFPLSVTP